jgi:hypothetical protein
MDLTQGQGIVLHDDAPAPATDKTPAQAAPPADEGTALIPAAPDTPADAETPEPEPAKPVRLVDELRAERQYRREAQQKLAEYEQRMKAAEPLLEAVLTNPDILAQITQQQTGRAPAPPQGEPEMQFPAQVLAEFAQDMGLYDTRGQLDLKTAGRVLTRQRAEAQAAARYAAEQVVQQHVAPVQQSLAQQQAASYVQQLAAFGETQGVPAERTLQVASALPPEMLLQENVGTLVLAVAAGLVTLGSRSAQPAQRTAQPQDEPPVFTERAGGRAPGAASTLAAPFAKVLHDRGLTDGDITKTLKHYRSGVPIQLED